MTKSGMDFGMLLTPTKSWIEEKNKINQNSSQKSINSISNHDIIFSKNKSNFY